MSEWEWWGATPASGDACPFLVPLTADRLSMYPTGAFCRRPDQRVRFPGRATLDAVCCTPAYRQCPGATAALATR